MNEWFPSPSLTCNVYPNVAEETKFLLDFMKAFRPGPKKEKKPQGGGVNPQS
uniref:Uncharacterized protein n=1 Tax=Candidatus Kentrum sp. DK TaxID=2126562 RepID=A0A450T1P7_9GAMM|nr:MAG: hypothetical protein BECKDK2373B_GA0170837_10916 [Candidatus Kentron sp. DK]